MKVVCFAGFSCLGKTTLMERVIPALKARGLPVSVIKHAHCGLEIDQPGKDTWRHREAGVYEALAASPERLVLQRRIEVWRAATGKPVRYPDDPFVAAIALPAVDALPQAALRPRPDPDNPDAVAAWLADNGDRFEYDPAAYL